MNKTLLFILMCACAIPLMGQEKQRIAVSATTGNADAAIRNAIEEALLESLSSENNYILVERAKLTEVQQEQEIQQSGFVDDEQMVEIGRMAGAQIVLLSSVNLIGGNYLVNYRTVDVSAGTVLDKGRRTANAGTLLDMINALSQGPLFTEEDAAKDKSVCGLEIQEKDAGEYALSRKDQKKVTPDGWRLPTVAELKCMCEEKETIGGFNYGEYWSSETRDGHGVGIRFTSCQETTIQLKASVRYVRSPKNGASSKR
jgi:hypothetical protein